MNKITKPISSPGRSDKFPPPLMRFLRSNVGSKSRRRSRASPMFVRKKNTVIETTQEPSSPKVTCIGQVRVRRSKKTKKTTAGTTLRRHRNRHCRYLKKLKPRSFCNIWSKLSKWVSVFRCGNCKTTGDVHVSQAVNEIPMSVSQNVTGDIEKEEQEHEQEHEQEQEENEDVISRSLPENAFLLTRCRSAPYRSSSLASIFRESTMAETRKDQEVAEDITNQTIKDQDDTCNESNGDDQELKPIKSSPLILSRCKSEPARRWDQLLV
ncbi:hypothetical protein R6Q59_033405 [Mikania micrantha]